MLHSYPHSPFPLLLWIKAFACIFMLNALFLISIIICNKGPCWSMTISQSFCLLGSRFDDLQTPGLRLLLWCGGSTSHSCWASGQVHLRLCLDIAAAKLVYIWHCCGQPPSDPEASHSLLLSWSKFIFFSNGLLASSIELLQRHPAGPELCAFHLMCSLWLTNSFPSWWHLIHLVAHVRNRSAFIPCSLPPHI